MSSLSHHGIKGQKWGVRRFQNKDGTRTTLGKHRDFERTASKVVEDLSNSPRPFIRRPLNKDKIRQRGLITQAEADQCASLAAGVFKQASKVEPQITGDVIDVVSSTSAKMYGLNNRLKQPTSIAAKIGADAKSDGVTFEQAANGLKDVIRYTAVSDSRDYVDTYNAIKQRLEKKGYTEVKCKNYFQKYQNGEVMHKAVQSTFRSPDGVDFEFQFQTPESQAAKELKVPIYNERRKAGNTPERNMELEQKMRNLAEQVPDPEGVFEIKSHSGAKHTSIGGTMYIEGNALILGDSSYLEHHGIRGQRWGVRRFQNKDGSLTNAGRKRLGYATKGAVQTVGKAFKAGVKAGGKAVKAVKAHHEAAEAKKKEKKKEKASKTRLGVMANKDLFTNEEIRKLNERFKLEDEMKMATLQKGVEIAKAVGTIAQNVGTMAKAYEDVTGQSLSPIKRKAAEEKAKQDAEDRKRKLAKEDAETKRAEDKEKRDIEDRERRIKFEDEDRVRKQAKEDADAQRAENAEKRAQAKEQRDSSMAVELQRKAKAAADEQEHKAVKAKAESRSAILDVLDKINKIQDHDDDDHNNNNPPGGGIDTWNDDDYLNFFKKTGIIHSDISDPSLIQNGVLFVDSSDSLAHHGVKGQRWGVRRFQNEDGSLTDKGRKHYEKALAKEKRKQASSDAIRGTLERQHPFAVTGSAIAGAIAAGMSIAATGGASVAVIAAGSAISAAVSAGLTHATYSVSEAWEGRGTRIRKKKIAKYEKMLKQSDMEEGMYHVENGTLFINAGEPYLEHHGVLGMKWGKHLRAGKGPADAPASAGGGGGEDDEKLKEMAKKAGMSVAEYRTKMASKLGGAASKVGSAVYDAAGGSHKKNAEGWRKMAQEESNAARASERSSHENSARAASQDRKYGSGGDVYRRAADSDKENAETHRSNAKGRSERAASEQAAYEKSLAGKYDKMKADLARKKSARQDKAFSGTSPKEKKRVGRKDQYLALPEQKKRSRAYDNKAAETRRARAERLTRDSEIFNRAEEESKRKQNSALNKGNKREAEQHGKNANFAQDWAEEGRRGAKDWRTGRRTGKPVLRTDSLDQVKKQHDKTLSGKLDKARHTIQRGKQKIYNAAGGKYKEAWQKKTVEYRKDLARGERAKAKGDHWNASAAGSMFNIHSQEANQLYNKYDDSLAGRYDEFKEKRKKKKAKHSDDTNAIYTEGTRLVVNSKWG